MDLTRWFKKNKFFWLIVFLIVFSASVDIWWWNSAQPLVFGLPFWVLYFILLTLTLSCVFYFFAKYHWKVLN